MDSATNRDEQVQSCTEAEIEDSPGNEAEEDGQPKVPVVPSVFDAPRGAFRIMIIRTLREAEPGKPLCISYIDWDQPVAARRRKLLEEYFFECMCERCVSESQVKPKPKRGNKKKPALIQSNKPQRIDGL